MAVFIQGDSPQNSLYFFHVPKTGGTWVTMMLEAIYGSAYGTFNRKHATPLQLLKGDPTSTCWADHARKFQVPNPYETPFLLFVRHPLDWYGSYYRFRTEDNPRTEWYPFYGRQSHILDEIDTCASDTFRGFIKKAIALPGDGFVTRLYRRYMEGLRQKDRIGRQEHLAEDLEIFLDQTVGLTTKQRWFLLKNRHQKVNATTVSSDTQLDDVLRDQLLNKERKTLESFGYVV